MLTGLLRWRGGVVGRLVAGEQDARAARRGRLAGDFVEGDLRERVRQRLAAFVRAEIERRLAPLFAISGLPLGGVGRGLAFQLADALGALPAGAVASEIAALDRADRAAMAATECVLAAKPFISNLCCAPRRCVFAPCLWAVRQRRMIPPLPGGAAACQSDIASIRRCRRHFTPRSAFL